jgi:O-antigen biosynthesis protein
MKTLRFMLATTIFVAFSIPKQAHGHSVEVRGKGLVVDGHQFIVKGIHYGPWRPGTGPGKGYPYPGAEAIESDLRVIRSMHVNTILVVDPPGYVLDLAERNDLKVLYSFYVNWWTLGTKEAAPARNNVLQQVQNYRDKPALLGWVLGNEIPLGVIEQRGEKTLENGLAELYRSVKVLDKRHPATHSNWPVAKDLNLDFFDIVSFNVYPLWPPQVVALGFGRYIEEVLQPFAAEKPLLITEFGVNSLEAKEEGQARLLSECWRGLQKARVCGGVVFEFADEWWKNYDNPRRAASYWDRKDAPDDEKTHDQDPERYYGLVRGDRQPKPTFAAVQRDVTYRGLESGLLAYLARSEGGPEAFNCAINGA